MMADAPKVIYINGSESVWLSACRDTVTFGALCATAWFLNTQMPPSGWINAVLAISWFLWILGRSTRLVMTPDQVRELLDKEAA